ncbi:hypothetical protein APA_1317 [Pseudanabaena sp. lw0831]|uniref:hypothetical protein n=1 Tax=Pseudanabaena sp. lw0831 TaxID=1357935 RepID=UPI001916509E|nr:hypothetical protein [Pseudanabaena sp. lw0831]GBO53410.1 hypothetical protein APA_1317 [Pseudanabaena sp. lw0831]
MNPSSELTYQLLSNQIQLLWNEEFSRELGFGKYSKWALNITSSQIIPMLSAIGHYGRSGLQCLDIDTRAMFSGRGIDGDIKLCLNQAQQNALIFLGDYFWNNCKLPIPIEYTEKSPYFIENTNWIFNPTSSDLYGVIWHIGGFGSRFGAHRKNFPNSINGFSPRAQECLICLMRVAQSQLTYYQFAGERFPLRENH